MKILSCRHDFDMVWWKLKETESMELIKLLSPASYFSHAKNIFLTWKHGKTKIRSTSVRHDVVDYYISIKKNKEYLYNILKEHCMLIQTERCG